MNKVKEYKSKGWMLSGVSPEARNIACNLAAKERKNLGGWIEGVILDAQQRSRIGKNGDINIISGRDDLHKVEDFIKHMNEFTYKTDRIMAKIKEIEQRPWWRFW